MSMAIWRRVAWSSVQYESLSETASGSVLIWNYSSGYLRMSSDILIGGYPHISKHLLECGYPYIHASPCISNISLSIYPHFSNISLSVHSPFGDPLLPPFVSLIVSDFFCFWSRYSSGGTGINTDTLIVPTVYRLQFGKKWSTGLVVIVVSSTIVLLVQYTVCYTGCRITSVKQQISV